MGENTLEVFAGADATKSDKERVIIYGRAGIGKTRLALSLTERFGKIAYFAADNNTWLLSSIDKKKRDRVIVVRPKGDDPTALFMQFAMTDWTEVDPEIKTLVVDTYTKVAMDTIAFSANTNSVSREPHYIVGEPGNGGIAIPNRGDYQAVSDLSKGFLDMLFLKQADMHIIFVCHEDVKTVSDVNFGGPSHPGRVMTEYLPGQFSTVVRLIREPGDLDLETGEVPNVVIAITEHDGKFVAKLRTDDESAPNPLGRVKLDRDPINFWKQYDAAFAPAEAKPAKRKAK